MPLDASSLCSSSPGAQSVQALEHIFKVKFVGYFCWPKKKKRGTDREQYSSFNLLPEIQDQSPKVFSWSSARWTFPRLPLDSSH